MGQAPPPAPHAPSGPSGKGRGPRVSSELIDAVGDFITRWSLEDRFEGKLQEQLSMRDSWREDLVSLGLTLEQARVPAALLSVKLREMADGTFEAKGSGKGGGGDRGGGDRGGGDRGGGDRGGDRGGKGKSGKGTPAWMMDGIRSLCDKFSLDERLQGRLEERMRSRESTFKEDMQSLSEILETARNPPGLLSVKLREMEDGTFAPKGRGKGEKGRGGDRKRNHSRSRSRSRDRRRYRSRSRSSSRSRSRRRDRSSPSRSAKRPAEPVVQVQENGSGA